MTKLKFMWLTLSQILLVARGFQRGWRRGRRWQQELAPRPPTLFLFLRFVVYRKFLLQIKVFKRRLALASLLPMSCLFLGWYYLIKVSKNHSHGIPFPSIINVDDQEVDGRSLYHSVEVQHSLLANVSPDLGHYLVNMICWFVIWLSGEQGHGDAPSYGNCCIEFVFLGRMKT